MLGVLDAVSAQVFHKPSVDFVAVVLLPIVVSAVKMTSTSEQLSLATKIAAAGASQPR